MTIDPRYQRDDLRRFRGVVPEIPGQDGAHLPGRAVQLRGAREAGGPVCGRAARDRRENKGEGSALHTELPPVDHREFRHQQDRRGRRAGVAHLHLPRTGVHRQRCRGRNGHLPRHEFHVCPGGDRQDGPETGHRDRTRGSAPPWKRAFGHMFDKIPVGKVERSGEVISFKEVLRKSKAHLRRSRSTPRGTSPISCTPAGRRASRRGSSGTTAARSPTSGT